MIRIIKRAHRNFSRMTTAEQTDRIDLIGGTVILGGLMIWLLWIAAIWWAR